MSTSIFYPNGTFFKIDSEDIKTTGRWANCDRCDRPVDELELIKYYDLVFACITCQSLE